MKKDFEVMGSDGSTVYCVSFKLDADKLHVGCNCQAGRFGKWCKHRTQLVLGNLSCLRDKTQSDEFHEILECVKGSKMAQLVSEVQLAETVMQKARTQKEKAIKQLEIFSRR